MDALLDRETRRVPQKACHGGHFETLMGNAAWAALKPDVRRRFTARPAGGESVVYRGIITETMMSRIGWLLAQACRLVGAPLPLDAMAVGTPAIVSVTEDPDGNGQFWTRTYGRKHGFPQVIHSSKRFAGPTGLEEYVGCGVAMALSVHEDKGGIVFTSESYHTKIGGWRLRLPSVLAPGKVTVRHDDLEDGYFAFSLDLVHPWLGTLIHQRAVFTDTDRRARR